LLRTQFPRPLETINEEVIRTTRWEGTLVHTRRDGGKVVVASRWSLQMDDDGQPLATLETNNDITEQERTGAEMKASERKYRTIFETVGVSIWEEDFSGIRAAIDALKAEGVTDLRRYLAEHPEFTRKAVSLIKIHDVNHATLQLFDAETKDDLRSSLNRVFVPGTEPAFVEELITFAEGRRQYSAETVMQSLQGKRLDVLFTITFPPDADQDTALVSIVDITERKRSQEALERTQAQLAHVNRVSALGALVASIGHEVSQPIASILVNAETALRWLNASPPNIERTERTLSAIATDGKRAGEILGRIRAMAKKEPMRRGPVDINEMILEIVELTHTEVQRNGVRLQTHLQRSLPPVLADRTQIQQVLLNFTLNAVEATSGLDHSRRRVLIDATADSHGVAVAVRDSGIGIDEGEVGRLFEPFYTTKPSGMGMGLSICRSIIEAHGGRVRAVPNPDCGATFEFFLPAHDNVHAERRSAHSQ
jgi:C4-dicarboxylate-specific signal transduction histidine kinase